MDWHAVDALDGAVDATRRFLFPFEAVRWARLAFLALVMAGGGIGASHVGTSSFGASTIGLGALTVDLGTWAESASPPARVAPPGIESVSEAFGGAAASGLDRVAGLNEAPLVALAAVTLPVALALVAGSFAFRLAFYDAFAATEVALWRPLRARFRQASGLLALLAGIAVVVATPIVALVAVVGPAPLPAVGPTSSSVVGSVSLPVAGSASLPGVGVPAGGTPELSGGVTAALGVVGVTVTLVGVVASRLTFEFVAPAMVARDVGVIAGWRTVWASLRGSWGDVAAYLVVHALVAAGARIVLTLAVGFAAVVAAALGLVAILVAAIPLGGVEAVFGTTAGLLALATVLLASVVSVVAATLPVRVVTRTYLTAYEVSTLAGIDPELSPLASSAATRGGETPPDSE